MCMYKRLPLLFLLLLSTHSAFAANYIELERKVEAQGNLLIENQQIINDLQSELSMLRGQLEEVNHTLEQTVERQKKMLQQLSSIPSAPSSLKKEDAKDLVNWSPTGNDKVDYNVILKFIAPGKQDNEAIEALLKFLQTYPKSTYCANVNYWLGQLYYKQNKKNEASFYYATVVKSFPASQKASESLYKIGLILFEKGEKSKAKAVFEQIANKYPKDIKIIELAAKKLETLG